MATSGGSDIVSWKIAATCGPARANHVGCVINTRLYIHGGIHRKGSTSPCSDLHYLDLKSGAWHMVREPGAPALSHHACVVLQQRYIMLIGGWDGKARISDVYVFDTQEERWFSPRTSGFPAGAGLSSHTATLLSDDQILIIGREGSLRMQRREGSTFLLVGTLASGAFKYSYAPLAVSSRSGHTAHVIGANLYILGGRSDKLIEIHQGFKKVFHSTSSVVKKIKDLVDKLKVPPMKKPPCGRKSHVAVEEGGSIFLHGGETFDGRSRDPVGEIYLMTTRPHVEWRKLGNSAVARQGHVCCVSSDGIILHGGLGPRGVIHCDAYTLDF